MKHVGVKRAEQLLAYAVLKPIWLREHPYCEVFIDCMNPAEIHHMKGRRGNLLTDERWFKAVCREHHNWIENNKREARKLGLILYR